MLKTGIVGLPNVGKSTLFNAVTRTRKAAALVAAAFCVLGGVGADLVRIPGAIHGFSALKPARRTADTPTEWEEAASLDPPFGAVRDPPQADR